MTVILTRTVLCVGLGGLRRAVRNPLQEGPLKHTAEPSLPAYTKHVCLTPSLHRCAINTWSVHEQLQNSFARCYSKVPWCQTVQYTNSLPLSQNMNFLSSSIQMFQKQRLLLVSMRCQRQSQVRKCQAYSRSDHPKM